MAKSAQGVTGRGGARGGGAAADHGSLAGFVVVLALAAAWAFLGASLLSFDPADPPTHVVWPANSPVANWCGPAGAWVAYKSLRLVGWGAWVFLAGTGLLLGRALFGRRVEQAVFGVVGVMMLSVAAGGFQALLFPAAGPFPGLSGGLFGNVGVAELSARFGPVGTLVWATLLGVVGGLVAFDQWFFKAPVWALRKMRPAARTAGSAALVTAAGAARAGGGFLGGLAGLTKGREPVRIALNDLGEEVEIEEDAVEAITRPARSRRPAAVGADDDEDDLPVARLAHEGELPAKPARKPSRLVEERLDETDDEDDRIQVLDEDEDAEDDDDDTPGAPQVFDAAKLRAKIAQLPIVFGHDTRKVATEDDLRDLQGVTDLPGYRFPGLDLLAEPEENYSARLEEYVREQAEALEAALKQYRIDGEVAGIESGPVITLFHVRLAPGTKVAAISAVSSDIARALKAVNIRIVANMQGRDTVAVEVPNANKEKVRLKELMSNAERFKGMKLPMFFGKDASGEPLIEDLTKMPHMLIAGTTGSGKSVAINTIIVGFLYTIKPSELKLVLVDPKMVEMSQFKDIPHLMCPVVTEMSKAAAILEWACTKMDERYELLAEAGCRDLATYNDLPWEELKARMNPQTPEEEARIPRKLPYMVFVIDELADLIMTHKDVEGSIIRIAQKARAVGIHLILATQRPQANVVTGLIKSNMPCRICFKVASGMDSRIVLDQKGGELLLGQGDMLFLTPRSAKLSRAQGTLVDDQEIRKVVRFMREVASPTFERQLLQIRKAGSDEEKILDSANNSSASLAAAREDPMFERAVEIVLETRRGSVSLLQRRLAIGYTRASRLIDLMGIAGIIGEHKGSVAREVMIPTEEWAAMKELIAKDAAEASARGEQPGLFAGEDAEGGSATPSGEPSDLSAHAPSAPEDAPFDTDEPAPDASDEDSRAA